MSLSKSFANHIICYHNKLNIMTFLFFFQVSYLYREYTDLEHSCNFGVSVNRDRDFIIITKMAASMRHNFIKPIIPMSCMYAHNMHFRNKSSNANSTNEMKNPKENASHYFHPRKNQKYKKVQGSSIGKSNLLQSYPGVRQLDEITGDHV